MRRFVLAVSAFIAAPVAAAQQSTPHKLIVVIVVDGLSEEVFERHQPRFAGGLAKVSTGTRYKGVSGSSSASEAVGRVASLLKSSSPSSLVVTVAASRDSATALGGSHPDQLWYWSGSGFDGTAVAEAPKVIERANAAIAAKIGTPQLPLEPPGACSSESSSSDASARFARAPGDARGFASSPAIDGAVLATSAALSLELRLGADLPPDLLLIEAPATAAVARRFSAADEAATCLQLLSLDRDLDGFLGQLDRASPNYAVVLIGSAAGQGAPLLFWSRGMASRTIGTVVETADIEPTLGAMLGLSNSAPERPGRCLADIPGLACATR